MTLDIVVALVFGHLNEVQQAVREDVIFVKPSARFQEKLFCKRLMNSLDS